MADIRVQRHVGTDAECEAGIWQLGAFYYLITPLFAYVAKLVAVTGGVVVVENVHHVDDTERESFESFFTRKSGQTVPFPAGMQTNIDRGGLVAHKLPSSCWALWEKA